MRLPLLFNISQNQKRPANRTYTENKHHSALHGPSLVAQMVKKRGETWVQSLGWEDPLEKSMTTYSSILAWRIPMDRGAWRATVHGVANSWKRLNWLSTVQQDSGVNPQEGIRQPSHCLLPGPQQGLGPKSRQDKGARLDFWTLCETQIILTPIWHAAIKPGKVGGCQKKDVAVLSFSIIFRKFSGHPGKGEGVGRKAVVLSRLCQSKGHGSQAQHPLSPLAGWFSLSFFNFYLFYLGEVSRGPLSFLKALMNLLQYCFCCFLCSDFLAARHGGSLLLDQGLNLYTVHWKAKY